MGEGSNPLGALLGFWMLMQLVSVLLTLIGGLYGLWCLNRLASSSEQNTANLERLAAATERLTQERLTQQSGSPGHVRNVHPAQPPIFPAPMAPVPVAPQPPAHQAPVEYQAPVVPQTPSPQTPSTPENRPL